MAALHSWRPTFYRVTSEANIADLISRADCTLAVRHGWTHTNTKLEAVLEILAVHRAASDLSAL